jgi:hypothetical protein
MRTPGLVVLRRKSAGRTGGSQLHRILIATPQMKLQQNSKLFRCEGIYAACRMFGIGVDGRVGF